MTDARRLQLVSPVCVHRCTKSMFMTYVHGRWIIVHGMLSHCGRPRRPSRSSPFIPPSVILHLNLSPRNLLITSVIDRKWRNDGFILIVIRLNSLSKRKGWKSSIIEDEDGNSVSFSDDVDNVAISGSKRLWHYGGMWQFMGYGLKKLAKNLAVK
jgi:hypothetical protein